ncbi:hypothetical protein PENARI_c002G00433 [Penicillium arizonense]|uniref:Uncharacterized protein n=1 Tax=Penicillium arizonense TaxID=1835702 RepID=A0A1F5LV58_PENAI|nr:hypothetical protein PENARI_c002G00433 [Penicillium arizonense]OGE56809.1 hypothetical protein PENARI_c002G00433 [Penicillium arizonense]
MPLKRTICSPNRPQREIPSFMKPSALQDILEHNILVDFFFWPNFRDHLILTGWSYAEEQHARDFVTRIRFCWDYEFRDIYRKNKSTGHYSFSQEFNNTYNDLHNWEMPPSSSLPFDVSVFSASTKPPNSSIVPSHPVAVASERGYMTNCGMPDGTINPVLL